MWRMLRPPKDKEERMLKRKIMKGFMIAAGAVMMVFFQNCGEGFVAQKPVSESSSGKSTTYLSSVSNLLEPGRNVEFNLTSDSVSGSALYEWSHKFNGISSFCTERSGNRGITYVLSCASNGDLQINLAVTENGVTKLIEPVVAGLVAPPVPLQGINEILMTLSFEIPDGTGVAPWNSAVAPMEVFVGQALRIQNLDTVKHQLKTSGRPCVSTLAIGPGETGNCLIKQSYNRSTNGGIHDADGGPGAPFFAVAYDGIQLYAQSCAGCHGGLANSTVLGKRPSAIYTARAGVAAMIGSPVVQSLTPRQIEAISYILGGR